MQDQIFESPKEQQLAALFALKPLSFLTGFFGQNFAWLVNRIGSLAAFVGIGIGTEVVAVVALVTLFRTRGWMGNSKRS